MKTFNCFFSPKINKLVVDYWKILTFNAGGKPVTEETWACFLGLFLLETSELATRSPSPLLRGTQDLFHVMET